MRRIVFVLPLCLPLLACSQTDPYDTPGTWQVKNDNDANLRAMIVNPNDLVSGQSAKGSWGQEGASAVQRLVDEKTKPLMASPTSTAVSGAGGGQ